MLLRSSVFALALALALPLAAQDAGVQGPFALGSLFSTAPKVSFGLEGALEGTLAGDRALGFDSAYDSTIIDPAAANGEAFWARSSLGLGWEGLDLTGSLYFDQGRLAGKLPLFGGKNNFWTGDLVFEGGARLQLGPLAIEEKLYYDAADTTAAAWYENLSASFESGQISAGFSSLAAYDRTASFLILNGAFDGYVVGDAWMKAEDLFGGLDLKLGGVDARYLRLQSLFFDPDPTAVFSEAIPFLSKPVFISQNQAIGLLQVRAARAVGGAAPWAMDPNAIALSSEYGLGSLTLLSGARVPFNGAQNFQEWLRLNNLKLGGRYAVEGLGTFDAGWELGLGYKRDYELIGPTNYKDYKHLGENRFWLDAEISRIKGLELRSGLDLTFNGYSKIDDRTGAGSAADPFVLAYGTSFVANLGLEGRLDLSDMAAGLGAEGGIYASLTGGKTYDKVYAGAQTFDAFLDASYPTATFYRMKSLKEQAYLNANGEYDGTSPLVLYLAGNYALNERLGFKLSDQFMANADTINGAAYAAAPLEPVGYYSLNLVEAGVRLTEGSLTFSLDFGWLFALGLPSADDLQLTDALAQAAGYSTAKDYMIDKGPFGSAGTTPWTLKAGVKVKL